MRIRIVCRPPQQSEQKSPQSEAAGKLRTVTWVQIDKRTTVQKRNGEAGTLFLGQAVCLWTNGVTALSYPGMVYATWVYIEPALP